MHFMSIANKSFWGIGDNKYPNGVASFLRTTANGGFSIKCLYVTVGVGYRTPGGGGGWVGGWMGGSTLAEAQIDPRGHKMVTKQWPGLDAL